MRALALFSVLCASTPVRATALSSPRNIRVDSCATLPPPTDTIGYHVYAVLRAPLRKDSLPTSYTDLVLDGLRHGLVIPQPLTVPAYAPFGSPAGFSVMAPAILGEVSFTLDASGKVSDIHLTQSSLSPALDRALYDAPRRADSLAAFPPEIGISDQGKIRFFVSLTPFQRETGRSLEFFNVRMPAWRGSQPTIDPRQDWQPTFPVTGRQAAVGDSVALQFVVDEHGVPIATTVRVLTAQYIDYARLVVDAALKSRYVPATAAGCSVKGLFQRGWKMTFTRKYE